MERVGQLDEPLARSLVVSLHARATRETMGRIGRRQLELMPDGSILVNAARGALLDYDALADMLARGELRCAALDVFPQEPLPSRSPLRSLDNVIMTPHVAGASTRTASDAAQIMAEEVRRYLLAAPPDHPV